MNDASLHDGLWPDIADHLGQPLESITHDEEDVLDAAHSFISPITLSVIRLIVSRDTEAP